MARPRRTIDDRLMRLSMAAYHLGQAKHLCTPDVAPQAAKALRRAEKSLDGAIRHAQGVRHRENYNTPQAAPG